MRTNLQQIIDEQPRQHTAGWYKVRLGKFTGSQVGRLMKKGRGKDAEWSADALTYIKEVVAERLINPVVLDVPDLFDQWLDFSVTGSKMTAWGNDQEDNALQAYTALTGNKVTHCGSLPHETLANFWNSPDGLVIEHNKVVEVKCPAPKTHAEYLLNVHDAEGLKAINPQYYWQVMAHMANTGAQACDWMSYCPFLKPALHVVTIERNEDEIAQLEERIALADAIATEWTLQAQGTRKPTESAE